MDIRGEINKHHVCILYLVMWPFFYALCCVALPPRHRFWPSPNMRASETISKPTYKLSCEWTCVSDVIAIPRWNHIRGQVDVLFKKMWRMPNKPCPQQQTAMYSVLQCAQGDRLLHVIVLNKNFKMYSPLSLVILLSCLIIRDFLSL